MNRTSDFPVDGDLVEVGRLAALGRLTPGALHEIANPLVALLGTAELLLLDAERGTKRAERLGLGGNTASEAQAGGGKVPVATVGAERWATVTVTGGRGSGLGLDACAAIARAHGGE